MPGSFRTHTRPGPAPGLPPALPHLRRPGTPSECGSGEFPAIRGRELAEVGHPTRRGAGRNLLSVFYLTVAQGRGRTDFIVASWEQLGLLLPSVYHTPLTKRAACISFACVGKKRKNVQGF